METYTLVVVFSIGIAIKETRTPNLTQAECEARAAQVDRAQGRARCLPTIKLDTKL